MKKKLGRPISGKSGTDGFSVTMPKELVKKLDEIVEDTIRSRSSLIAEAVKAYLDEQTVFGTYRLADGKWQTIALFGNVFEAWDKLMFHAQGRGILISDDAKSLTGFSENVPNF